MKPTLFIGSSTEALEIAYAAQEELERDADVTVWTQGIFSPSRSALDDLVASASRFDFALFIFNPDDELRLRGATSQAVRDNVLFELGLFMGRIGRERVFFVVPNGVELHIATDLLGINPLRYRPDRSDLNVRAAIGAACNKIRRTLKSHDQLPRGPSSAGPSMPQPWADRILSDEALSTIEQAIKSLLQRSSAEAPVLLFADLDGFNGIAKCLGKEVADAVMEKVAKLVQEIAGEHYWTRFGGDQILLCLTGSTIDLAMETASELVDRVARYRWENLVPNLYVHISVGVARAKLNEDIQAWIIRAINGSISAKKDGGNRVRMAPIALPRSKSRYVRDQIS